MSGHIHIDVHGGLAGDMFVASMLDAFPHLKEALQSDLLDGGITEHVTLHESEPLANGIKARHIEFVSTTDSPRPTHHYKHIKDRLQSSALNPKVLSRTLAIFDLLANAEANVHGVSIDDVHFHEVADWDSQADIVAAASLIEHSKIRQWSCGSLPLGSGTVQTEHGELPIPAPATTLLLRGFMLRSDSETGERITPTGAAILKYLINDKQQNNPPSAVLHSTGIGCGTKRFKSIPNIVRLLVFSDSVATDVQANNSIQSDTVSSIHFDIDDMTPEELSVSCDHLRQTTGVIDLQFTQAMGKKARPVYAIQMLAKPEHQDTVIEACFEQTSTIGLRYTLTPRYILNRSIETVLLNGEQVPIKKVTRPNDEITRKAESDVINNRLTLNERRKFAMQVQQAIQGECNDDTS